jgi:Tol biopolymer transport system component
VKRVTALTLVITAAFFHGVTAATAEAVEVGGGPGQRWDCLAFGFKGDIYVVNLDGTGLTYLTADDDADGYLPAFSPDGTKIAYSYHDDDSDHWVVYVMNADGSDKRRLSPPDDVLDENGIDGDYCPVFTPDGERVAVGRCYESNEKKTDIIFFPTGGGAEENFSTKIEDAWELERRNNYGWAPPWANIGDPAFSGDGRKIAFRDYPGVTGLRLWVVNADGSGARLLAEDNAKSHAFSPDGKKLAFYTLTKEGRDIYVVNADGTGRRQLTDGGRDWLPTFSPDGKKVVYESSVGSERGLSPADIYIMNADGSGPRALTQTPEHECGGRFTPDGSKIVFVAWALAEGCDAGVGIYIMNADGSERRFLVAGDAAGDGFSLGPSLVEGRLLDSYGNWHDVVDDPEATPPGE